MKNPTSKTPAPSDCLGNDSFIASWDPAIRRIVQKVITDQTTSIEKAIALYLEVRDSIAYTPYRPYGVEQMYHVSSCIADGKGCCVEKSAVLAACARSVGIPARVGYANVKNHLSTPRLLAMLETDIFYWHGYTELWLNGIWVKATPVFDAALCEKMGVDPLAFDGLNDSIFQPHNSAGHPHMEYLVDHGRYADVPAKTLMKAYAKYYPKLLREYKGSESFLKEAAAQSGPEA